MAGAALVTEAQIKNALEEAINPEPQVEGDVISQVLFRFKAPHPSGAGWQYLGSRNDTYPGQTEPSAYAAFVEDESPQYRNEALKLRGRLISEDLSWFSSRRNYVLLDAPPDEPKDGVYTFFTTISTPPEQAWQLEYNKEYAIFAGDYKVVGKEREFLMSTPVYPGRFHRSFITTANFDLMFGTNPGPAAPAPNQKHTSLEYMVWWKIRAADPDNEGRTVIRDGDKVFLEMLRWEGTEKVWRGDVATHKPSPGPGEAWDWQGSLGTEQYTSGLDMEPIEFTIEVFTPPRH